MIRYCKKCILPDTRPNLRLMDDGVCNACHSWSDKKKMINWESRKKNFERLVKKTKSKSSRWDCVIPVSGGKDSTWQVIKALEYELKPLCVTWRSPARSELGQQNLDNLIQLGVDHIDFSINPKIEKALTIKTFKKLGAFAIPMHMALFAIPLRTAIDYKIPLVLWGENSGMEYGGNNQDILGFKMTREWLMTYGVTQGTVAEDWVDKEISLKDIYAYLWPSDKELADAGVISAFLGWYFPWDPHETYRIAELNGFKAIHGKPKTGLYNFADVDDSFLITLHHWMKWYKFGFTRLWDNLSLEIRMGNITREIGIDMVNERGEEFPSSEIREFCQWSNMTEKEFIRTAEKFRNNDVWTFKNNNWVLNSELISGIKFGEIK